MVKKKPRLEAVSETELQILDQLWQEAPKTIRQICTALYPDTSQSYYATVQSLLDRLEKKGWVRRDRNAFKHQFYPVNSRSDFVGQQIQQVANAACGGSITALLGQLAAGDALTVRQRRELRKLIDGDHE